MKRLYLVYFAICYIIVLSDEIKELIHKHTDTGTHKKKTTKTQTKTKKA